MTALDIDDMERRLSTFGIGHPGYEGVLSFEEQRALLAEVRRLRAGLAEWQTNRNAWKGWAQDLEDEIRRLDLIMPMPLTDAAYDAREKTAQRSYAETPDGPPVTATEVVLAQSAHFSRVMRPDDEAVTLDLDDLERRISGWPFSSGQDANRCPECDLGQNTLRALIAEVRRLRSALEAVGGMQVKVDGKMVVLVPSTALPVSKRYPGMLPVDVHACSSFFGEERAPAPSAPGEREEIEVRETWDGTTGEKTLGYAPGDVSEEHAALANQPNGEIRGMADARCGPLEPSVSAGGRQVGRYGPFPETSA